MKIGETNPTFVIKVARAFVSPFCPRKGIPQCSRVDTCFIKLPNLASPTGSCTCSQLFA